MAGTIEAGKVTLVSDNGLNKIDINYNGTVDKTVNWDDIENTVSNSNSHIGLSGVTAYHLLQGNLAVDNTVTTQGFATKLYTGNGSTQAIDVGIDFDTQWGNTAEEKFGGLVWIKGRSTALNHSLYDSVRGATKLIASNVTNAESIVVSGLTAFSSTGFSLGSLANENTSAATQVSWNFQTTHRITGTTNHGKAYTCHYNPFTGFTIVKYEGSGIAGHEIPHHLGRRLGFATTKLTSTTSQWRTYVEHLGFSNYLLLNGTSAVIADTTMFTGSSEQSLILGNNEPNTSGQQCIMYGWANSYFDESNKLIGSYEVGTYQGTGASGNKVKTRGKPAWIMVKRLDSTGNWNIVDNQRTNGQNWLYLNLSSAEYASSANIINSDGFTIAHTNADWNASGGQYLYMVAYDTNSNGGGSYYPRATDTSNLQVQNAIIPFANGIDSNGSKITTLSKNETISGLILTAGKNYVYSKNDGAYGVKQHRPRYLDSDLVRTYAGESPDYYDVKSNKWFNTNSGSELVTNGTFDSGISGWVSGSYNGTSWVMDSSVLTHSNGTAKLANATGKTFASMAQQYNGFVIGKKYKYIVNVSNYSGLSSSLQVAIDPLPAFIGSGGGYIFYRNITNTGLYEMEFTASSTSLYVSISQNSNSTTSTVQIDNISVFEADIVPTTEISESRNYMNHIVYADNDGSPLYVEELPKIEYKDSLQVNSLNVLSGFNLNQTWQDMTSQRVTGATYTNTTGKPIEALLRINFQGTTHSGRILVNDVIIADMNNTSTAGSVMTITAIVPNGAPYKYIYTTAVNSILELR